MPPKMATAIGASILLLVVGSETSAQPQGYPNRTIKLIVPFGSGGPTDLAARLAAQVMQSALGQSVVVENRPGAGGATGTKAVAGADPDGHTLLLGTSAILGVLPALVKNPGFDPIRSFAAVAKIADSASVLVVPAAFPANSVAGFVAYAKANPGKLSYASAGAGNQTQLSAELFKAKTGLDVVHVPYKSGAEMVTAILSEQVQLAFPDISVVLPLIREARLRALAVTSATRHPQLPDVPTMAESGIGDFSLTFWTGVVAPAATPQPVVDTLNGVINGGLKSAQIQEALAQMGAVANPLTPQEFARFIASETVKWGAIAKGAGVSAD
jgi:tripartite-type tricarboxylate transporter receptor subunit TctC